MIKKKKDFPEPFDSWEEQYFEWWLKELLVAGFIYSYKVHPKTFELSEKRTIETIVELKTKTRVDTKTLLQSHVYTPDFHIVWNREATGLFVKKLNNYYVPNDQLNAIFWSGGLETFIDVKPEFDKNNMTRLFIINQKWVYEKYDVFVEKVIPERLFKKTFTPKRYLLTNKSMRKRKLKYEPKSLQEFLSERGLNGHN